MLQLPWWVSLSAGFSLVYVALIIDQVSLLKKRLPLWMLVSGISSISLGLFLIFVAIAKLVRVLFDFNILALPRPVYLLIAIAGLVVLFTSAALSLAREREEKERPRVRASGKEII